uniref:Uncharacterized protein n=1 Tax=Setaria viridis TaxID=4556 RepID=A0A4U6TFT6_SETVI|nr:uncharacterized protein LOC117866223 [Setaria viridis]TKV99602.1 hypothetical protein SEVIR_8G054533v2 [Setaria viridis]
MRTEVINTDSIFEAAKRILRELEEAAGIATSSSRPNNVIYFDGWDGLGAAAAEEDPAPPGSRRAPAAAGPEFSHVFHIDCSKWESRRAMQRTIAEKLELPAPVMDMLDAQDEEDDYHGVDRGSRAGHGGDISTHTEADYEQQVLSDFPQREQRGDPS